MNRIGGHIAVNPQRSPLEFAVLRKKLVETLVILESGVTLEIRVAVPTKQHGDQRGPQRNLRAL